MNRLLKTYFYWMLLAVLYTPLLVFPHAYLPFQNGKVIAFMVLVELIAPVFLFLFLRKQPRGFWKNASIVAFCVYAFLLLVVSLLGVDLWNSFFGSVFRVGGLFLLAHIVLLLIMLRYAVTLWGEVFVQRTISVLIIGAVLTSFYGVFEYFHLAPTFAEIYAPRASSLFGNPSFFASFLVIPFFFACRRVFRSQSRVVALFYAVVIFSGIIVSGTRAALLGVVGGLIIAGLTAIYFQQKIPKKKLFLLGVSFFTVGLMVFSAVWATAPQTSVLYRLTHFYSQTASQRINYWSSAIDGFSDHAVLGVGYENYYQVGESYFQPSFYSVSNNWPDKPHNNLLEILVTGGMVSFLAYVLFLLFVVRMLWKRKEPLYLAALVGHSINMFFIFDILLSTIPLLLLIAISQNEIKQTFYLRYGVVRAALLGFFATITVVISMLIFIFPYYQAVVLANTTLTLIGGEPTDVREAAIRLTDTRGILVDPRMIAEVQMNVLRLYVLGGADFTDLEPIFDATEESFEYLVEQRPNRARHWEMYSEFFVLKTESELLEKESQYVAVDERAYEVIEQALLLAPNRIEAAEAREKLLRYSDEAAL
jgi:O-antigen ligase